MAPNLIRQNPTPAPKNPPVEYCPRHGTYTVDWEAAKLRKQATGGDVPTRRARALLEQSEQIRRYCPGCGGQRPTDLAWATSIRSAV